MHKGKEAAYIPPDAIFKKLYEAAPTLTWHVSPDALSVAQSASVFTSIDYYYPPKEGYPAGGLGMLNGAWVYIDEGLQGRTIELRSGEEVLSTITLD